MADDSVVPSLSPDDDKTPAERPPMSKSQQKRIRAQKGEGFKYENLDPKPLLDSMQVVKLPENWPSPYKRWRVLEDKEYPHGPSTALVHCGDILSEQNFDIPRLQRMGVKLEKVEE